MKRLVLTVLGMTILGMAASGISWAEESDVPRNQWEIGPEVYYFQYREPDFNVKFDGVMSGVTASFTHHHPNRFMLTAAGRGAWGEVDYTGSGKIHGIQDWTTEGRIAAGYEISIPEKGSSFTPFFGIGYRYLNDDSSGKTSTTGAAGYDRESNYLYSPAGLEFNTQLDESWNLRLSAEYDIFWRGEQKSHLEDVDPSFNIISNTQNNGYGVRASLKLEKKSERFDFLIGPYVRWWRIGNSKSANVTFSNVIIGTGFEPENESLEAGGQFTVRF